MHLSAKCHGEQERLEMFTRRTLIRASAAGAAALTAMQPAVASPRKAFKPATFVLVHGGSAGGWNYKLMAPYLREAGHTVYTPTLTGAGERFHLLTADTGLSTHIEDVISVLKWEDLAGVILVGHSYGGMVITGVADRVPERLSQMVYLDAAHPKNGESLVDVAPAAMAGAKRGLRKLNGVEVVASGREGGPMVTVEEARARGNIRLWQSSHTTPWPWKAFSEKIVLKDEAAIRKIPRTNINCKNNQGAAGPGNRQRDADRVWEIDTDHDLFVQKPREVADMLLKLTEL
jgi:pimeloyl-ACP methyl ester carboxylesterase